jgi:hypothetical protein
LVDTSKTTTTKRFVTPATRRRQHTARLRQVNARRQKNSGGAALSKVQDTRKGGPGGRGGRGGGRYGG